MSEPLPYGSRSEGGTELKREEERRGGEGERGRGEEREGERGRGEERERRGEGEVRREGERER